MSQRQRIDVWLWRVRLAKSRALAASLVSAGNVRLVRNGQGRRLEKPSTEVEPRDILVLAGRGGVRAVRVLGLPERRGPAKQSAALYAELDAEECA